MSSVRRYVSPRLLMPSRRSLPPEESWRGTKPNHAASWRPFLNVFASPILATSALAVIGPIPGIASSRRLCVLSRSLRLEAIPGIGPITASALVASIGDAKTFKNGRQLAAWNDKSLARSMQTQQSLLLNGLDRHKA